MTIGLGASQYGKAETRVVRVRRDGPRHEIRDLSVTTTLRGDFAAAHTAGDQSRVLPTDSQKNTVFAYAKEKEPGEIEDYALDLARHFAADIAPVSEARVEVEEYRWDRITAEGREHPHAFVRSGQEVRTTAVTVRAGSPASGTSAAGAAGAAGAEGTEGAAGAEGTEGAAGAEGKEGAAGGLSAWVVSGLTGLVVLKSTGSEFAGFLKDRYTTLEETSDRILATSLTARWRYASPRQPPDGWTAAYAAIRQAMLERFATVRSKALQQSLWEMGRAVLEARPEVAEIRLSAPNKHHFLVDLRPFGLDNPGEVFYAADRPYGLIQAEVRRAAARAGLGVTRRVRLRTGGGVRPWTGRRDGVLAAGQLGGGARGEGRVPGRAADPGRHGRHGRPELRQEPPAGPARPEPGQRAGRVGAGTRWPHPARRRRDLRPGDRGTRRPAARPGDGRPHRGLAADPQPGHGRRQPGRRLAGRGQPPAAARLRGGGRGGVRPGHPGDRRRRLLHRPQAQRAGAG